jgi:hypothetical protein
MRPREFYFSLHIKEASHYYTANGKEVNVPKQYRERRKKR